jgi:hypothetical protein
MKMIAYINGEPALEAQADLRSTAVPARLLRPDLLPGLNMEPTVLVIHAVRVRNAAAALGVTARIDYAGEYVLRAS